MAAKDDQIRDSFLIMSLRFGVKDPSEVVWQRFASWCATEGLPNSAIDRALLWATAKSRVSAWMASAYAGRFCRYSALRRREVALLAFLECEPVASLTIDTSSEPGPWFAWLKFLWWGTGEALGVLLGLPIFAPIHVLGGKA